MKSYDPEQELNSPKMIPVTGGRQGHFTEMAPFEGGTTWIGKWKGISPWEKHAKGDEFIHVLRGEVEIDVLTAYGRETIMVPEGNIFVVPRDHWHRQRAKSEVIVLGATPGVTEHSDVEPQV